MKVKFFIWKTRLLFCCLLILSDVGLYAQTGTIQGHVLDAATQEPLIGVSVHEKGGTNGTITDLQGMFNLKTSPESTIAISYIGYKSVEFKASAVPSKILLNEDTKTLDEVVVVGYGVQKKVNLSGAVTAIDGEKIAAKPVSDALSALQGELPGVAVLRSSGEPGSETSGLRVRGFTSVNSTKTLVLIDGIEGDLTLLNANDIESISVLKDAAASSIYGARAAAGVVLVTTKSGKPGKAKITYNGYFAVNTPGNMPERLPAWEEQGFIDESRRQAGGTPEWNPEQASWVGNPNFNYRWNPNGRWDYFQATNWVDEGTRDIMTQQNHSVSLSGGSKEMDYLVSANYYTKQGILKFGPDQNERYNIRAKINSELNKYVSFALNVSYDATLKEANPYGPTNILERLYRVRGRQPIYAPEEDTNDNPFNGDLQVNAVDLMQNGGINKTQYESYLGKGTLTLKDFVKGLRVNLSASRKAGYFSQMTTKRYLKWDGWNGGIRFDANNPNSLRKLKNSDTQDLLEATVNYNLDLGKHSFGLLAGSTYEKYRKDEIDATVKSLNSNDFFSFNYYDNSVLDNTIVADGVDPWAMMSYFGRFNYNYAERYLFEANVRYDGSSRLAPGKQWRAFPSFSGAWRLSEENWFKNDYVDNLKLRTSWGQLGNGAVLGLYDYLPLILSGSQLGDSYYYQDILASKTKTWEIIQSTNIGFDLGILKNRLNVTADYYWKNNNNMLVDVKRPSQIGIKVPKANDADMKVWGWEFEIGWKDKIKDLSYQVSFNLSDSQNEVTRFQGQNIIGEGTVGTLEGYPMNTIWGYKTDGYWKSRQEYLDYKAANPGYQSFQDGVVNAGDIKYVAQGKADHAIKGGATPENPGDLVCFGDANGRYLYGFNIGMQWRGFDFSMQFQGVGKRTVMMATKTIAPLAESSTMPWTIHRNYAIVKDGELVNPDASWPRLYNYNNGAEFFNYKASDRWVQDGSYLRLKNVTLGYTLPLKKDLIEKCRIYVSGVDVWEHTNMLSVFDPEVGNNAAANYYPFFRTWTMGLNVTF